MSDEKYKNLKILVLQHEQRGHFSYEPGHLDLTIPISEFATVIEYPYQRLIERKSETSRKNRKSKDQNGFNYIVSTFRKLIDNLQSDKIIEYPPVGQSNITEYQCDLFNSRSETLRLDLHSIVKIYRPDVILLSVTFPDESLILSKYIDVLRQEKVRPKIIVIQYDYTYQNQNFIRFEMDAIKNCDKYIIVDDPIRANQIKNKTGRYVNYPDTSNVVFCPCPVDHKIFYPKANVKNQISLTGSSEGQRKEFFDYIITNNLPHVRTGGNMKNDLYANVSQYSDSISGSLIGLNTQTQCERDQLKLRALHILYSGSFLVEQECEATREIFSEIDHERFSTKEELLQITKKLLENPENTRARALSARRIAIEKFNTNNFMNIISSN